jgi:hypothetical protein
VEVPNRSVPNSKYLVTGQADWVMGYSCKDEDGALLVALLTKRRSDFSNEESQLIVYLAIQRENRRKAGKTNIITQGFYSDGSRFGFVCIKNDETIAQSSTLDTHASGGLTMIFSFIVAMLKTALNSTPTASPSKPSPLQDKKIHHIDDEAWSKLNKLIVESLAVDNASDVNMMNLSAMKLPCCRSQ